MGLRVPPNIAKPILEGLADLGFTCDVNGTVTSGFDTGWGGTPYPPPGYLPWNRLEVGNGDTFGFYWPIGHEEQWPIVCTLLHDSGELLPLASSLEAAARLHIGAGRDAEEWEELCRDFGIIPTTSPSAPEQEADDDEPAIEWDDGGGGIRYWGVSSSNDLFSLDPSSPPLLLQRARELLANRTPDFKATEAALLKALKLLPEYTDAWWLLAQMRRRQRAPGSDLIDALVSTIASPLAFGDVERRKCLNWLQRLDDSSAPDCVDPIWKRRKRLRFAQGVKDHDDHEILSEAIDEYHGQGLHLRAVRLRILVGELMGGETVSFRERRSFTWPAYWAALRGDVERAGLHARLIALQPAEMENDE